MTQKYPIGTMMMCIITDSTYTIADYKDGRYLLHWGHTEDAITDSLSWFPEVCLEKDTPLTDLQKALL